MRVLAGDYMGFFLLVPCDEMPGYYGPNQSMGYHRIRVLLIAVLD